MTKLVSVCGGKAVSILFLSLGTKGRTNACSRNLHLNMDTMTTVELGRIREDALIPPRIITLDKYMLLTTKQSIGESIEHFFGKLKVIIENCEPGNEEDTLIRDLFFANLQNSEIQKGQLKETVEPAQALHLAINMELGQWNHIKISDSQPALQLNAITLQRQFRNSNQCLNIQAQTFRANQLRRNCGLIWSANHRDKWIAKGKTCINVRLQKYFLRVCREPKSASTKTT